MKGGKYIERQRVPVCPPESASNEAKVKRQTVKDIYGKFRQVLLNYLKGLNKVAH